MDAVTTLPDWIIIASWTARKIETKLRKTVEIEEEHGTQELLTKPYRSLDNGLIEIYRVQLSDKIYREHEFLFLSWISSQPSLLFERICSTVQSRNGMGKMCFLNGRRLIFSSISSPVLDRPGGVCLCAPFIYLWRLTING